MRVAIAGQTYYPGNNGQAIFTIHLAEGLARAGHEVHMIAPGTTLRYTRQTLNGVVLHSLPSLSAPRLHPEAFFNPFPDLLVQRIFKASPPDVVHLQDHYFLCRGVAAVAHRQHIPILGTNHFLPENLLPYFNSLPLPRQTKINILWDLMLWTYNRLKLVTTPTETAAAILRGQKIRVPVLPVSCGVDTQAFAPVPEFDQAAARAGFGLEPHKTLFLYVGRHDGEKRIDLLLRGLALLRDQGRSDLQLALAGQGAAKGALQALSRELGLEKQVHFLGYVDAQALPRLYLAADIFAMPSPEELQSIATLEAMASGKPILAADARALPELVAPGVNGRLFTPGSVDSAAAGMAELADNRAGWARMGAASRSRAGAHSLETTIRRYEALYHRVGGLRLRGAKGKMRLRTASSD